MIELNYMKLSCTAHEPTRAHADDAGLDLYSDDEVVRIPPQESEMVHTNIAVEIPKGYFGHVVVRSSQGRRGLRMATGASVIDSGYRGEVGIPLFNDSNDEQIVRRGERIAQMIIIKCELMTPHLVLHLSESDRGTGGFGSTGE